MTVAEGSATGDTRERSINTKKNREVSGQATDLESPPSEREDERVEALQHALVPPVLLQADLSRV
jgi:hypothetical protein